jgi:hypothetical protein
LNFNANVCQRSFFPFFIAFFSCSLFAYLYT